MSELKDNSIQCVVTSPPYWGLRKYSGEQDLIWGDNHCEHEWRMADTKEMNYVKGNPEFARPHREHKNFMATTNTCTLCNSWRGAYGLEPTPEMYIEHTIEILREIRRVLRKDGVVFWNIGDSYATNHAEVGTIGRETGWTSATGLIDMKERGRTSTKNHKTLKPKDLCLIPFRVAIAAQEDGWWVRSVIIWSKPNPMPESVTDRPTESHEYILMLTKSKKYYWDADAVREPSNCTDFGSDQRDTSITHGMGSGNSGINEAKRRAKEQGTFGGRNIRSVWTFPTQPYPKVHFSVFPEKIPEICIKAASKEGDLILDPFAGAGTTLWVAKKLNRKAIGYELSEEYCEIALERNRQQVLT